MAASDVGNGLVEGHAVSSNSKVRFGSLADIAEVNRDVCFVPEPDIRVAALCGGASDSALPINGGRTGKEYAILSG